MPYIKSERRPRFDAIVEVFSHMGMEKVHTPFGYSSLSTVGAGDMVYLFTRLLVAWLPKEPTFSEYSTALGILEAAKLELYRRRVAPYENSRLEENGDVYA